MDEGEDVPLHGNSFDAISTLTSLVVLSPDIGVV
jgi:hypothetical protein